MFLTLATLTFAQTTQVQNQQSLLKGNPAEMRGYVVVNNDLFPNLKKAVVKVIAKSGNNETTVYVKELTTVNYVKLPDEILELSQPNTTYTLSVSGYDANGTVIY